MRIRDMKVKTKLLSSFAAMALLVLATSVLALISLSESNGRFRAYLAGISHRTQLAADVRNAANARAIAARNLVLVTSDADRRAENANVTAAHGAVQESLAALRRAVQSQADVGDRERQLLADIDKVEALYGPVALHIVALALEGKRDDAIAEMNEKCRPLLAALLRATQAFVEADTALAQEQAGNSDHAYARDIAIMASAATLAAAAALVLGWLLSNAITGPLKKAAAAAEAVASGDLSVHIEVNGRDETGQLLDSLQRMTAKLGGMVSAVRVCADGIQLASSEIAAGNQDLSMRTEQQASALQETASSMTQMTSTVHQNAEASNQANELALAASAIAAQGGGVVHQVVRTMSEISESSQRISEITGVIDGIAFQTNILALNAAVEAARAGEQGRGFAVVAGEVRSLAKRSADAAREIKALIGASVERVETGTRFVSTAGSTMTEIVAQVDRVSTLVAEIKASTSEQSAGISQVNRAVGSIDESTQQNAALVEQSAAAAHSLHTQASDLTRLVGQFKI